MTQDDLLYRFRLRTFAVAAELGNVRAACRAMGIHPSTFYRWKRQLERVGCVNARGVSEVGVSCCVPVLVDQSTEDIAAAQPTEVRRAPCFGTCRRHRRRMGQAPVRAPLVVMLDVES